MVTLHFANVGDEIRVKRALCDMAHILYTVNVNR